MSYNSRGPWRICVFQLWQYVQIISFHFFSICFPFPLVFHLILHSCRCLHYSCLTPVPRPAASTHSSPATSCKYSKSEPLEHKSVLLAQILGKVFPRATTRLHLWPQASESGKYGSRLNQLRDPLQTNLDCSLIRITATLNLRQPHSSVTAAVTVSSTFLFLSPQALCTRVCLVLFSWSITRLCLVLFSEVTAQ